jgi:hypothetical protein
LLHTTAISHPYTGPTPDEELDFELVVLVAARKRSRLEYILDAGTERCGVDTAGSDHHTADEPRSSPPPCFEVLHRKGTSVMASRYSIIR